MTVPSHPDRRQQLAELRRQIRALDLGEAVPVPELGPGPGPVAEVAGDMSTGEAATGEVSAKGVTARDGKAGSDAARCGDHPLELVPGLHEICPAGYLDTPAALAVQAGLMATHLRRREQERPVLWVRRAMGTGQDFGRPYPPALAQWGLDPARLILVETGCETDTLWTLEEGLKTGAVVIGETGPSARYDLTATRRLDQAARRAGALALVLRPHEGLAPSAALSRWRIAARPSPARAWIGARGLPGLGEPRFHAALERVRGGPPQDYEIEWKHASFHVLEPAPLADRPASPKRNAEPYTRPASPAPAGQLIRLTG
ncbi:ImuA family protein [Maricaulis maris]|uniref:ImuA family protein n=1 Tax=Maricaulis maris TaxID=74318 RepID=UPI003B8B91FF